MKAQGFYRAGAPVLAVFIGLAIAQSCSVSKVSIDTAGDSNQPVSPVSGKAQPSVPAASLPPLSGLPPLPVAVTAGPRSASYQRQHFAWGGAVYDSAPGSLFPGLHISLSSSENTLGWSTYVFNTGDYQPVTINPHLLYSGNAPVYIGISDYERNAWRFYGPLQGNSPSISLPPGIYQDSLDQVFVAVVVYGGGGVGVKYLALTADNGLPPGNSISGIVLDEHGEPLPGIKLSCDAPGSPTAYTDSAGGYEFNALIDGTYTIEPDPFDGFSTEHMFTPPSRSVVIAGSSESGINFTAERHDINGGVLLSGGPGLAGVLLTLTPGDLTTTSSADGSFNFPGVADGTYSITPLLAGYSFNPPVLLDIPMSGADNGVSYFVATGGAPTYRLTGHVVEGAGPAPLANVVVTLLPTWQLAFTDSNGDFEFNNVAPASYTLDPNKGAYVFSPPTRLVTVSNADVTGLDFSGAMPIKHTVSGAVYTSPGGHPIYGVLLRVKNAATQVELASTSTLADGSFSVEVAEATQFEIRAERSGMEFNPAAFLVPGTSDAAGNTFEGSFTGGVSYTNFVQPYFSNNCLSCHSTTAAVPVNPMLQTYAQAFAAASDSNVRIQDYTMPPTGGSPASDMEFFAAWVADGAPEN